MDDVIVVGGRCAGAPTAMLLARAGLKVRVIERSPRLGEIPSGHIIGPSGVARLRRWGLLDAVLATGCPPIREGRLWIGGELAGDPPDAAAAGGKAVRLIAPRHGALGPVLLDAARQAGAAVEMGRSVRGLLTDGARVTGVSTEHDDYEARLVVGADGKNSRVAKKVGAGKYISSVPATYAYWTYWAGTGITGMNAFVDEGHFIGMCPTNDELALVFFQGPHAQFDAARRDPTESYLRTLKSQPAAMEVLAGGVPAESVRGTGDLPMYFRVSAGPGWVLAGDAGHFRDPLIARGIPDAFRDAELIADAVAGGWDGDLDQALAAFPAQRDAIARPLSSANDAAASAIGSLPLAQIMAAIDVADKLDDALDDLHGAPSPAS
jgi:2-polyprenyl-6-methoxyphenol hydroxylase-like FAD-dependent oxidoreductase